LYFKDDTVWGVSLLASGGALFFDDGAWGLLASLFGAPLTCA